MKLTHKSPIEIELSNAADALGKDMSPGELANLTTGLQAFVDVAEDLLSLARRRQLDILKAHGTKVTEKGTVRHIQDGWVFEARPRNTGFDPRKMEALLRAKSVNPATYMAAVVKFAVDPDKTQAALDSGIMTKDELETCRFDESFTVQKPKKDTTHE